MKDTLLSYGQVVASMIVGALCLAYAEFCWLAHHDFFLVKKEVAQERRYWNEVYDRIAVSPHDEMNGEGP